MSWYKFYYVICKDSSDRNESKMLPNNGTQQLMIEWNKSAIQTFSTIVKCEIYTNLQFWCKSEYSSKIQKLKLN